MHLSFLSLQIALLLVACNAAPVYRELSIEARDDLPSLNARDEDFMQDGLVARVYPGPGMRHKHEEDPPITAFRPVPHDQYFKTPTNVYSGKEVNDAAKEMLDSLHSAPDYRGNVKSKLNSYPKPSTGFRGSDHGNPAPNDGTNVAYHAPIGGPPELTMGLHGSMRVGSDRIVAYRKKGDQQHTIGVSYHDPNKPIPVAQPNQLQSNNNPFSMAQPKKGKPVKAAGAKAKTVVPPPKVTKATAKPIRRKTV